MTKMAQGMSTKFRMALLFAGGLLIGLALSQLGVARLLAPGDDIAARFARQVVLLGIGVMLLLWIVYAERRPPASIGFRRPNGGTFVWGVVGALALIASFMLCYALIFPAFGLQTDMRRTGSIIANPYWLQLIIFACAAIVEEIVYRGYLIERSEELTDSKWLAFAVSVVVFTLAHLSSWAPSQLIVVAFGAVIMALLYVWKRDLIMVMIAHFLADVVGFALAAAASP